MKRTLICAALVAAFSAPAAMANQAGDFVVRFGATTVAPNDDSGKVVVDALGTTGMEVSVDNNTQLGLNFAYFFTPNWAVEVLAATPFSHDINLQMSELGLGDGKLAETKHLPPTISALYYFNSPESKFQPYVGAGINYTIFFDDNFTDAREDQTFQSLELDDSFGLSAQLGIDYKLENNWLVNASIRYIDIDTEADFEVAGSKASVDVDIDPWVYTLSVGYRF